MLIFSTLLLGSDHPSFGRSRSFSFGGSGGVPLPSAYHHAPATALHCRSTPSLDGTVGRQDYLNDGEPGATYTGYVGPTAASIGVKSQEQRVWQYSADPSSEPSSGLGQFSESLALQHSENVNGTAQGKRHTQSRTCLLSNHLQAPYEGFPAECTSIHPALNGWDDYSRRDTCSPARREPEFGETLLDWPSARSRVSRASPSASPEAIKRLYLDQLFTLQVQVQQALNEGYIRQTDRHAASVAPFSTLSTGEGVFPDLSTLSEDVAPAGSLGFVARDAAEDRCNNRNVGHNSLPDTGFCMQAPWSLHVYDFPPPPAE